MARYDKYEPLTGGHRAVLAADWPDADLNRVVAVGLDGNGRVVAGDGQTGVVGVLVLSKKRYAGDVVDIMQDGEIVDLGEDEVLADGATVAGTRYYADDAGAISTTDTGTPIGWTAEATRLIVRVGRIVGAGGA